MSAIAIATLAAAGAAIVFFERRRVRSDARQRCARRRSRGVVRWAQLVQRPDAAVPGPVSRGLVASLQQAVLAGDEVCVFEHRLFAGRTGESPFRFRRSRVDRARRRFGRALVRVREDASGWLGASDVLGAAVQRYAVHRVVDVVSDDAPTTNGAIDAAIDALENALANLHRAPDLTQSMHPFR